MSEELSRAEELAQMIEENSRLERDRVTIYNCDPTKTREYYANSKRFVFAPLGQEIKTSQGAVYHDHQELPRYLFENWKQISADLYNRAGGIGKFHVGWLTIDEKVYQKCLKDLKEIGVVSNPLTPSVKAMKNSYGRWQIEGLSEAVQAELEKEEKDEFSRRVLETERAARKNQKNKPADGEGKGAGVVP